MTTPNTSAAVKAIEEIYGGYVKKDVLTGEVIKSTQDVRDDVGSFLLRRFKDDEDCLKHVLRAIKERQAIRFGPPDVATIVEAIQNYEEQYGVKIARAPTTYAAPSEAEIEETRIDCKRLAEERGIDTTQEFWMAKYFYMLMAEQKAKED